MTAGGTRWVEDRDGKKRSKYLKRILSLVNMIIGAYSNTQVFFMGKGIIASRMIL